MILPKAIICRGRWRPPGCVEWQPQRLRQDALFQYWLFAQPNAW
jgi:hypothetical protein